MNTILDHTRASLANLSLRALQKVETECFQVDDPRFIKQHNLICEIFLEKISVKSLDFDVRLDFYNRVLSVTLRPFFPNIVKALNDDEKLKLIESISSRHALLIIQNINYFLTSNKIFNFRVADRIAEFRPELVLNYLDNFKLFKYHEKRFKNISFRHPAKEILFQLKAGSLEESKMIKEHARRRVDFFFYTAMAVYNDGYEYCLGNTILQYGRGEKNKTEGAHSTLITNLGRRKIGSKDELDYSFYSRFFVFHAINSTCEVSLPVNDIDANIEGKKEGDGKLRAKAIEILNRVSRPGNDYTPECAVNDLLSNKDKVFEPLIENPAKAKIAKLQREGMDLIKKPDGSVEGDFFKWNILLSISDKSLPNKKDFKKKNWESCSKEERELLFVEARKEILTHRFQ
jgi:hypothetical protein